MNLLFITRKYPPSVGGMENVSYALAQELSKQVPTTVIAWGGSQAWLPYFLPKAFFQALWLIYTRRITHIYLGDALLAPLGLALKILTRRPVSLTVHGLDITFNFAPYQAIIPKLIKRLDRVIAVSTATLQQCTRRGIPGAKCTMIPWGVYPDQFKLQATRAHLETLTHLNLTGKTVLLTVGRLVKRKGVAWFVQEVMPSLGPDYHYLIAGEGPDRPNIEQAIAAHRLQDQVKLLGAVSNHDKKLLYNTADIFLMPNIPVIGTMEGFGIVAIEASSVGLPVVGSNIEGIRDAVLPDQTGCLVPPYDPPALLPAITKALSLSRPAVAQATYEAYSWPGVATRYVHVFESIATEGNT